jgi:hypothetical protein
VCAGQVESQRLQLEGRIEGLLLQKECTESKNSNTWSVFEEVSQGVGTGIFPKGLEDFSIKLRRDRIFKVVEEKLKRASALKYWKKVQQCWFVGGQVS